MYSQAMRLTLPEEGLKNLSTEEELCWKQFMIETCFPKGSGGLGF